MINANDNIKIDRQLLLEFFLTFSRFEHALKAARFARRGNSDGAEPNWYGFALQIKDKFNKSKNKELELASNYFFNNPPSKQVLNSDGGLGWRPQSKRQNDSDIWFLLRMIKSVRNNLFHGGKHNNDITENQERSETLLRNSIIILNEALKLNLSVKSSFDSAII